MARNSLPMMSTGGGVLSKLVGALVTIAVIAFVVKHPADAAHLLTTTLTALGNAVAGLANFLQQMSGQ